MQLSSELDQRFAPPRITIELTLAYRELNVERNHWKRSGAEAGSGIGGDDRIKRLYPKLLLLDSGRSRTRLPVAAKIALQNAATNGGTPGSPTPAGGAELSVM